MIPTVNAKLSVVLLGALLLPQRIISSAQSLGELARQARKEREASEKKGKVPVHVYTNDDIARMPPIAILESSHEGEAKLTAPSHPAGTPVGEPAATAAPAQPGKPKREGPEKPKEYWLARIKVARAVLAHAEDEQTLVEEEIRLLQIQQARELGPDRSKELNRQIDASAIELEARRAATEKARQDVEELEKDFKNSGAPQEWVQKKDSTGQ